MSQAASSTLRVRVAPALGEQLRQMKARASANPSSGIATMYRGLRSLFDTIIAVREHATRPETSLGGNLKGVRRDKVGRLRVFYIVSEARGEAIVLYVGQRKAGDRADAYEVFTAMIRKGVFDEQFAELGLAKPAL